MPDAELLETDLTAVFAPVLSRIAAGAGERERDRRLPFEEIGWLRDAGFGRLRVPREHGGFGASLVEVAGLLVDLAAADSNLVQALRGHIGFAEFVRSHPDPRFRERWWAELAGGALVGNAESERTGVFSRQQTRVEDRDGALVLNGTKYYTTGSIFADWILVSATDVSAAEPVLVTVQVPAADRGVRIEDDWDGFGQRLTGSGTAVFSDVPVNPATVTRRDADAPHGSVLHGTYQLVHLAALAGIAAAALRDITDFVRSRPRNLFNPAVPPTEDPVALQVVGEAYGTVRSVRSTVLGAAAALDAASAAVEAAVQAARDAGAATGAEAPHAGADAARNDDAGALAALVAAADAHVFGVQSIVIDAVVRLTGRIFEVGGASATSSARGLDRHWRNARTVSSHNPALYRQQAVGGYVVNGVAPGELLWRILTAEPAEG